MRKRLGVLIILMAFVFTPFLGKVAWAAGEDVILITSTSDRAQVGVNQLFKFTVTIKNEGSVGHNNVTIELESSNFNAPSNRLSQPVGSLNPGETKTEPFYLTYDGGGSGVIHINIINGTTGELITSGDETVNIVSNDTSQPPPTDNSTYSKYAPVITIEDGNIPTVWAGDTTTLTLNLKNTSSYRAENISITPQFECGGPFTVHSLNPSFTIDKIDGKKSGSVTLTFTVSPNAENKVHTINLRIKYYNAWNVAFPTEAEAVQTIYVKVNNIETLPKLSLGEVKFSQPAAKPNQPIELEMKVSNSGSLPAKNVKLSLVGLADGGFSLYGDTNVKSVDTLSSGKEYAFKYTVVPSQKMESGNYALTAKIEYQGEDKSPYSMEQQFFIPVENGSSPRLSVAGVNLSSPAVQPSQTADVELTINNQGNVAAKDVRVTLTGLKDDGFSLFQDTNLKRIESIGSNQGGKISYTITPSKKMESGSYALTAKIDYKDEANKEYTIEQQFFVPVENNSMVKTVPKMILSRYSCDPVVVRAGENFNLSLTFMNTSKDKNIRNIKIYFTVPEVQGSTTSGGSAFTPVNGSNTIFIDEIGTQGIVERQLEFFTIPDANPKTYTMTANFEYEDSEGTEYKSSDIIGIPVSQSVRLDTTELEMPTETFIGQPLPVSLEFYNTGKVKLQNMMVRLEGDFDVQNGRYFVGNFDVGASDYFEGMLIPTMPGTVTGAVILSYDEPTGETIEITKDFTLNVVEAPPMEFPEFPEGMNPDQNQKGLLSNPWLWGGIGGGIALLIVGVIVVKKIKKRKAGIALDE